jgi:hypothetical protein
MKTLKTLAIIGALAAAPMAANAEGMDYTYVEGGYAQFDLDGVSGSLDGFFLRGSVAVTDQVFLSADYLDVSGSGADTQLYTVGVGGRYPLSDVLDVTGRVAYVGTEASGGGFSADDDGYSVGAGLRGRLAESFELEGNVTYYDVGDGDDTALGVAARYFFTDQFAVGAEYTHFDDADLWGLGVRYSFGK